MKDNYSHYPSVYFLSAKSEVLDCLKDYMKKTEKHCLKGIGIFRADNGLEFINQRVTELLESSGLSHHRTVVYCSEQKGKIERENRTVNFDLKFWSEAVNSVAHVLNSTEQAVLNKFPYELWHGRKLNINDFHTFDEEVFIHIPDVKRDKLYPKARKGLFLGYDDKVKGFRIWISGTDKVAIERKVVFSGNVQHLFKTKNKETLLFLPDENLNPGNRKNLLRKDPEP